MVESLRDLLIGMTICSLIKLPIAFPTIFEMVSEFLLTAQRNVVLFILEY
jgi:hypothetical protein